MPKEITLDKFLKNYGQIFEKFSIDEPYIRSNYKKYLLKTNNHNFGDYIWYLFNKVLTSLSIENLRKEDYYFKQSILYSSMLHYRRKYENVKANEILKLYLSSELLSHAENSMFVEKVTIISGNCCDYCNSMHLNLYD